MDNEYRDFKYRQVDDSLWRICYPGGFKIYKKADKLPDDKSIEKFIDDVIEACRQKEEQKHLKKKKE